MFILLTNVTMTNKQQLSYLGVLQSSSLYWLNRKRLEERIIEGGGVNKMKKERESNEMTIGKTARCKVSLLQEGKSLGQNMCKFVSKRNF